MTDTATSLDEVPDASSTTSPQRPPLRLVPQPVERPAHAAGASSLRNDDSQAESATSQDSSAADPATAMARSMAARSPSRHEHVRNLQLWEGTVLGVDAEQFQGSLRDLSDQTQPEEHATFALEEVLEDDRPLVRPGAVFYWHVSYNTEHGTRRLVSQLRFRRLPSWTSADVERVRQRAVDQYDQLFQADDD